MDVCFPAWKAQHQWMSMNPHVYRCTRICHQLDAVLRYIRYLFPVRDAVRTSGLSKRWEYLCVSLPNLLFNEMQYTNNRTYVLNFAKRASVFHEYFHNYLSLTCTAGHDASRINAFIVAHIGHNLQELKLWHWGIERPYALPPCILVVKH